MEEHIIEYQSVAITKHKDFGSEDAFNRMVTKDNVGVVAILQLKDENNITPKKGTGRVVLVSNTHIHWNPEHKDVKLMQVCR